MHYQPYPWHALEPLSRRALIGLRQTRLALQGALRPALVEPVLTELAGEPVRIVASRIREARPLGAQPAASCLLSGRDNPTRVLVELEPALAARLASRLLRRPAPLVDPGAPVPDSIQGAMAALVLAAARRLAADRALTWSASGPAAQQARLTWSADAIGLDTTLLLSDEVFELTVEVDPHPRPCGGLPAFDRSALLGMGGVPLSLPLVVGRARADASMLRTLEAGDVLLPGPGWWVQRAHGAIIGAAAACAPRETTGLPVKLIEDGRIMLGEGLMSVDDAESQEPAAEQAPGDAAAEVLGAAPILVRVELGQLSLTAREWAQLRPGDVIATGQRIADRAVLRIAGRQVATGELVDIEGELGVRIHELSPQHGESS